MYNAHRKQTTRQSNIEHKKIIVVVSFIVQVHVFSLNIQTSLSLLSMASSLFALVVAKVGLIPFFRGFGRVADLLVGLGLLERAGTRTLQICLVGAGLIRVTCGRRVSAVIAGRRAHLRLSAIVG
jgi:hypothetical protein